MLLYEIKYGRFSNFMINNEFYNISDPSYLDIDIKSLLSKLESSGYIIKSAERPVLKCNYCGNDRFFAIPYCNEHGMPMELKDNKIICPVTGDIEAYKLMDICSSCMKLNESMKSMEISESYKLTEKKNFMVELLHDAISILNEYNLKYEIGGKISGIKTEHVFNIIIKKDFSYLIDIYYGGDVKVITEHHYSIPDDVPGSYTVVFNIDENNSEFEIPGIKYIKSVNYEEFLSNFKKFVLDIVNNKSFMFGIPALDNLIKTGLKINNVYGFETFSSGNISYFLVRFLIYGAENAEPGIYITTRNSPDYIIRNARSYNIDLEKYIDSKNIAIMDLNSTIEKIDLGSDYYKLSGHISDILNEISKAVKKYGARRLVIDSIEPLELGQNQNIIRYLFNGLRKLDCVIVATKYIDNIDSHPIEDMYFSGIGVMGTMITNGQLHEIFILKKSGEFIPGKKVFDVEIDSNGEFVFR
ncbi:circadian clock protein KaiC [Picrophilus oshimae DSM 9789]|uniref:Circadian clock protein KaiC n=2 Tax=Picrophilus oshimae TaxID=46632 RepID=A0A8G2L7Q6_PICTO|nr:circadian clock protein KaiC [Picrophilus oshimae DSM 9789]